MTGPAKSAIQAIIRRLNPASDRIEEMLKPVSAVFGRERGRAVDRYYIENFVAKHASHIRGELLEVAESTYTRRYGTDVTRADVLHIVEGTPGATVIGDLTLPETLPVDRFDCFICTQTLSFVEDPATALQSCARVLKPSGTLILTVPGISQISEFDMSRWGDYWRFTSRSVDMLARRAFPDGEHQVEAFGNVFAAKAVLDGLAIEDVPDLKLLNHNDPSYQVVIGLWARKAGSGRSEALK
jgi:SAM-dependent methyltransferase